ncbi:MAG: peptidylprolyl isomerase [Bacteroidaceae bacterium]|nr:peptidylprolyl isomerase [Bacteroidaceae bacterium]
MKKILWMALAALMGGSAMGQTDDPVIMKINGKPVLRSEFEYSFNKNNTDGVLDKKGVKEYVPLYVDFKLKVAAAEDARVDTISTIKAELDGYKEQMLLPTIVDTAFIEREARRTYDNTAARFEGADMLTASHILFFMPQTATEEQQAAVKVTVDSIYNVLKAVPAEQLATRFAEVAKEWSQDKASAERGGSIGQFGKGMMIPDFEEAAYKLQPGEMSEPVLSTVGYHIIYLEDRHPFESYEYHHSRILDFLEKRGIKEASASAYIDSIAKQEGVTRTEEIDKLFEQLIARDMETKYLAQEYHDGTLMYEISKSDVWDKAQQDETGQEAYYKAHKKQYKWTEPRYSGIIIHGKDASVVEQAKQLLKGVAEPDWATTIVEVLNNDSVKVVRIERGLFKQGDNATIDRMAFGDKTKEVKPMKDFPETAVYGNIVKKPRTYKDVHGQVMTDYQNQKEQEWVEALRKKYPVEVYDDVVKTVNKH